MSDWLVLVLTIAVATAVVLAIALLKERGRGPDRDRSGTPDVIEYMTMMIGVVYAIVLGLAIAGVWEARNTAQATAQAEAQALHEVTERVQVFAPPARDRVRQDVESYVRYVVREEWPGMLDSGELTGKGGVLLDRVRTDVTAYEPRDEPREPVLPAAAGPGRRRGRGPQRQGAGRRRHHAGGGVVRPDRRGARRRRPDLHAADPAHLAELLLAGVYTSMIAFLLFLIWDFNSPFGHVPSDATDAFTDLFAI
ncbi:DUF4239 domain-containing protein [Streptomyces thioluteus]|uniref:DUF4239 domain-containing protein n=1 Tax=Streptomyces thioluteus TaxID=66431 RepID=A0ABN3WSL5_STRTU